MSMNFERVVYSNLNPRQQETFNFQKVSAVLADYGFTTIRLSSDWRGADFIAQHFDGMRFLKVQLKGQGLDTAFEAMRNLRLKEPVVAELDNSVLVQIRHERLASAEDVIMEYLDNPDNKLITNRVARGLTGINQKIQ
jgi:hypothetical protein